MGLNLLKDLGFPTKEVGFGPLLSRPRRLSDTEDDGGVPQCHLGPGRVRLVGTGGSVTTRVTRSKDVPNTRKKLPPSGGYTVSRILPSPKVGSVWSVLGWSNLGPGP